jgi:hypothetical protein
MLYCVYPCNWGQVIWELETGKGQECLEAYENELSIMRWRRRQRVGPLMDKAWFEILGESD